MALATVKADIAPIFDKANVNANQVDEVIYGMSVVLLQANENGWCYVRTAYGMEGYMQVHCLVGDAAVAAAWGKYKKMVVLAPYIDMQASAQQNAVRISSIPRGGIVVPLGAAGESGWQKVGLVDGAVGYTRTSYLGEYITNFEAVPEENMRHNLVRTALSYLGSAYRSAGRTPLGIDSVGLAVMAYMLNGVQIPRKNAFIQGDVLHGINMKDIEEGDLIYFSQEVGIYIGSSRFVHATSRPGSEGVVVSSLRSKDDDYDALLAGDVQDVASIY